MDVGNPEQKTITIFIKTPNQAHEDQTVEGVSLNWTVKDLKAHLSTVYPSRPVSDGADMLAVLAEVVGSCDIPGMSWYEPAAAQQLSAISVHHSSTPWIEVMLCQIGIDLVTWKQT